ncbi:hypothetical protein, partial [Legionella sp.]|uniref:hypothetical protein n=1 Tax=Legionella sp. TaxID=459 RepID=UPI003CB80131
MKLELRIPKNSDNGFFDTKIVYQEKNFETTLNQFFSLPLSADFFEKVTELSIVYDEQSLPIPEEIA